MFFLSDSQKNAVRSGLIELHNELSRNITIFQSEKVTFISTDDSYSGAYRKSFAEKSVSFVESEVKARVYYNNTDFNDLNTLDSNLKMDAVDGKCVIRVDIDGYKLLEGATKLIVDGKEMVVASSSKPVGNGVFNNLFWDFVLNPTTEELHNEIQG